MQISLDDIQPLEFTSLRPNASPLHEEISLPTPPQSEGTQYEPAETSPYMAIDVSSKRAVVPDRAAASDRAVPLDRAVPSDSARFTYDYSDLAAVRKVPIKLERGESQYPAVFPTIQRQVSVTETFDPENISVDDWLSIDQICRFFDATDAPLAFNPTSYLQALEHLGLYDHFIWKQVLLRAGLKEPVHWTDKLQVYAHEVSEAAAKKELEQHLSTQSNLFMKSRWLNRWLMVTVYKTRLHAVETQTLQRVFGRLNSKQSSLENAASRFREFSTNLWRQVVFGKWRRELKRARQSQERALEVYNLNCLKKSLQGFRILRSTLESSAVHLANQRDLALLTRTLEAARLKARFDQHNTRRAKALFTMWNEKASVRKRLEKQAQQIARSRALTTAFGTWIRKNSEMGGLDLQAQGLRNASLAQLLLIGHQNTRYTQATSRLRSALSAAALLRTFKDWQTRCNMHREATQFYSFQLKARLLLALQLAHRDKAIGAKFGSSLLKKVLEHWRHSARSAALVDLKRQKILRSVFSRWRQRALAFDELDMRLAQEAAALREERLVSTTFKNLSFAIIPYYEQEKKAETMARNLVCSGAFAYIKRQSQHQRDNKAAAQSLRDQALLKQAVAMWYQQFKARRREGLQQRLCQFKVESKMELKREFFQFWRLKAADLAAGNGLAEDICKALILRRWNSRLLGVYEQEQTAAKVYDTQLEKAALQQALWGLERVKIAEQELADFIGMRDIERCRRLFQRLRRKSDQAQFLKTIYERRAAQSRRDRLRNTLTLWREKTRASQGQESTSPETPNRSATVFRERTVDRWRRIRTPLARSTPRREARGDGSPLERPRPPNFSL